MDLINTYAQYDEDSDEWQIKYIALCGNNIAQTKRITEAGSAAVMLSDGSTTERRRRRVAPFSLAGQ